MNNKYLLILFTYFFFSCKAPKQGVDVTNTNLPSDTAIDFQYEVYEYCNTYYQKKSEDSKPELVQTIGVDINGNEIEVVWRGFESYVDATTISFYDSAGRTKYEYYRQDEGSSRGGLDKIVYEYDEKGKVLKSITYDFQRRIRADVDKGYGRPGGCIVTEEDYEKKKTWAIETIWENRYDDSGNLVERYAPVINSTQNRYLSKYDSLNRLIEERSLENDRLVWIEKYTYYPQGYEYSRTWFEADGSRGKNYKGEIEPIDIFKFRTDKNGNVTEEISTDETGRLSSRDRKYYDEKNRLIKHEIFNENNLLLGTYTYKYFEEGSSIKKRFSVKGT